MKFRKVLIGMLVTCICLQGVVFADNTGGDTLEEVEQNRQDSVDIGVPYATGAISNDDESLGKSNSTSASMNIKIEADKLTIGDGNLVSLNVPAVLPMLFAADGKTYLPTNWGITNHDPVKDIYVSSIEMSGNEVDGKQWTLESERGVLNASNNSTVINFWMGEADGQLIVINPKWTAGRDLHYITLEKASNRQDGTKQLFQFKVNRPIFTLPIEGTGAYSLNLTFAYD